MKCLEWVKFLAKLISCIEILSICIGDIMNDKTLKEYIKCIYELESALYQQNLLYDEIDSKIDEKKKFRPNSLKKKKSVAKNVWNAVTHDETFGDYFGTMFGSAVMGGIVLFVITFILSIIGVDDLFDIEPTNFVWGSVLIGAIGGGILYVITGIVNGIIQWKETSNYNAQTEIDNKNITQQNLKNQDLYGKQAENLSKELNKVGKLYNNTRNTLEKLYSINIIYPKYRNFVAISSFYEYFESGRCDTLKGYEGAYNIFENEVRQNIIIAKLDEVIERLDRIESSQYMLYSAINKSNQIATNMSKQIFNLAINLKEISNNSLISTYYQKETALNTEVLRKIETFRLLHEKY